DGIRAGHVTGVQTCALPISERIDLANPTFKVGDIPKVVGGVTPACTRLAASLYGQIVPRVHEVSSPKVAELAKLYENVFRNVNRSEERRVGKELPRAVMAYP